MNSKVVVVGESARGIYVKGGIYESYDPAG